MQEEINQIKEMMKGGHEGHNLEAPSSDHGSNSCHYTTNKHNGDEEDDLKEEDRDGSTFIEESLQLLLQLLPQEAPQPR